MFSRRTFHMNDTSVFLDLIIAHGRTTSVYKYDKYAPDGRARDFQEQKLCRPDQAAPAVSNMTASIDSRADFPAQITNWNAG